MNEEIKSLDALKEAVGEVTAAEQVQAVIAREPVRDELGRSYATGKRKDAVARVWIKPGSGKVAWLDQNTCYCIFSLTCCI